MKKIVSLLLVLCLLLTGCGGGNISGVQVAIGESASFTREEIEQAMDVAMDYFRREFDGCTMTAIRYDESKSYAQSLEWARLTVLRRPSSFIPTLMWTPPAATEV